MGDRPKIHIALTDKQIFELNQIERETDRPRARLLRRAIEEWLVRYREQNPEFAARMLKENGTMELEREFRPDVKTDRVVIQGKPQVVVIEPDGGWRRPIDSDYISTQGSILDGPQ